MQTILAQFKINPGKEAEAEEAMKKMAASVEASETGAVIYIFHRDRRDATQITVFEVYADDDAFAAHTATEHTGQFRSHFGTLFDPATVKIDRLERIAGFSR